MSSSLEHQESSGELEAARARPRLVAVRSLDRTDGLSLLYESCYGQMVRVAYLLTGSMAVAEDIVQDAFARLLQGGLEVEDEKAYLRRAVVNGTKMFHRRRSTERRYQFALLEDSALSDYTPELLASLTRLPYRKRAAIVLRYYQDWSDEEIAEALGIRPSSVRSLVHRGLARLRREVDL